MKKTDRKMKKLVLNRETILQLQTEHLDVVLGNATFTASNPCCPRTKVGCG